MFDKLPDQPQKMIADHAARQFTIKSQPLDLGELVLRP